MARARFKGRVPAGGKAPFCADCGGADCFPWPNGVGGHDWLCGSCKWVRDNPDAPRAQHPPGLPSTWRARRGKPQKDSLF